jgi:hypothetical protein
MGKMFFQEVFPWEGRDLMPFKYKFICKILVASAAIIFLLLLIEGVELPPHFTLIFPYGHFCCGPKCACVSLIDPVGRCWPNGEKPDTTSEKYNNKSFFPKKDKKKCGWNIM